MIEILHVKCLPLNITQFEWIFNLVHSDAFCLILVHWGLDKPLLKIQGGHKMKKCSPEKVSLIKCLWIDTLYTQNLDFITHELTCSRYDLAKVDFWQIQKLKISLSRKKSHMLIKSTVFNFLHIFQLIQTVLKSNFLNLVLNIHVCLYKNYKILFLLEKNDF